MLTEAEESEFWKPPRPHGFDPKNLNKFGKNWVNRFMKRQDMSVRRKTNKKKTSVFERMHKIQGYPLVLRVPNGICPNKLGGRRV